MLCMLRSGRCKIEKKKKRSGIVLYVFRYRVIGNFFFFLLSIPVVKPMLGPNKRYFFCVYPPVSRNGNAVPVDLYHVSLIHRQIVVIDNDNGDGGGDNNWVIVDYQISGLGSGKRHLTIDHSGLIAGRLVQIWPCAEQHISYNYSRISSTMSFLFIDWTPTRFGFFIFSLHVFLVRLSSGLEKSRRRYVYGPGTTTGKSLVFLHIIFLR